LEIFLVQVPKNLQNNLKNSPNFQNHKIEKENSGWIENRTHSIQLGKLSLIIIVPSLLFGVGWVTRFLRDKG
jgi:ABC-type uncharacterized transport system involved in gliding motility auxiliary subunit